MLRTMPKHLHRLINAINDISLKNKVLPADNQRIGGTFLYLNNHLRVFTTLRLHKLVDTAACIVERCKTQSQLCSKSFITRYQAFSCCHHQHLITVCFIFTLLHT